MQTFTSINCCGKLVNLQTPRVMGVLNLTPDSFYDGGKYNSEDAILAQVALMLNEGATFIDIGGSSSRPGSRMPSVEEEWSRTGKAITLIKQHFPEVLISVDTVYSAIARRAVDSGACMINDVSAGLIDSRMIETVAALKVPYLMMHMKGLPENMQDNPVYDDVLKEIIDFFSKQLSLCRNFGITDILIDPGFGFGKTIEHNFELLSKLNLLKIVGLPVVAGLSRKGMIWKTLDVSPAEALNGTTALNMVALMNGARILRVHDVKEAMQCIKLFNKLDAAN
ncbi:MAG TPA: dihydropteroate synthase [Bacteroidia bacterium]|nr:dihydropteroate synthase [Bacteroidia bacterium]HRH83385.1 dihydropteroate synthase [Bacteroidia bacterium]